MTTVAEMCARDVIVADPDTTIADAAKLMRQHHVGCLVIGQRPKGGLGVPAGIVTDRDLVVEVTALDLDPTVITIGDIMPGELVTIRADADVLDALHVMRHRGVRRLPVVNETGELLGLVAFDDLLAAVAEEFTELAKVPSREQSKEASTRR